MTLKWVTDPKSGDKSVSLTLLVVGAAALLGNGLWVMFGKGTSNGVFDNFFWGAAAMYFGRRNLKIGGKDYGSDDSSKT